VTTSPPRTRPRSNGRAIGPDDPALARPGEGRRTEREANWFTRHPDWPIVVLLAGWPAFWLLGLQIFACGLMAIPMAMRLYRWRATGTRVIRTPPGFGLWLLFLVVVVCGLGTIALTAPGTLPSPISNRVISWTLRAWNYVGITVILLYAGNLTERELPRRRLAWLLGLVGVYSVAGGILGTLFPRFTLKSPLAYVVPQSFQAAHGNLASLYPSFAQVQNILGYAHGRPDAPFDYTNTWGNCLAILLPWLLVAGWCYGTRRQRRFTLAVFALTFIPVVSSLDRGLWLALGVTIFYLAVRFAARGKLAMLGAVSGMIALAIAVILVTPVGSLISQRLAHGHSNAGRVAGGLTSLTLGLESPIVGWGDTRHQVGSLGSIAIGPTSSCRKCGGKSLGGDGELENLLITAGLLGAAFYVGFFAYGAWRYRRDPTPYGMAGVLVLVLGFVLMFVYDAIGPPMAFTMLAYALLWRNERERRLAFTQTAGPRLHKEPSGAPSRPG
jgi:hypothetical protein